MQDDENKHLTTHELLLKILTNQYKIMGMLEGKADGPDELERQAIDVFKATGRVSVSVLQSRMSIGYNKAARIMDNLEQKGLVKVVDHTGLRRELVETNQ